LLCIQTASPSSTLLFTDKFLAGSAGPEPLADIDYDFRLRPHILPLGARRRSSMSQITIYHNPACGTSRNTLALIRHAGLEPVVIEYLKTPPSPQTLRELVAAVGVGVRGLLREKGTPYVELGLADPKWSDEQLLDFITQQPILLNRPIVLTPLGAKLCRPSEAVLELLPVGPLPPFTKSDGEVVTDTGLRRKPV